jgi:acetylornithine deacetylase
MSQDRDAVGLLRELVAIPSESGHEERVVERLEAVFRALGWQPRRQGRNVYALLGDGQGPLLLLNSHTDTVPVGEDWSRGPFGELADGRIYGRGSNDAKGCLVAMILGTARHLEKGGRGRVCVAATCEEEVMGEGLGTLLPELPRPDAALVGEPTGLQPAVAQKGRLVLEVTAHGRSAHAAHSGGVNAIMRLVPDLSALSEPGLDRMDPLLGPTTVAVTQIQGGTRQNVIPDRCTCVVDIRLTPAYAPGEIVALLRERVKGEVRVCSDRLGPVQTPTDHELVQAVLRARPGAVPYGSPTLSDWVFLREIPTVKIGPGESLRSHTPDEFITVDELLQGVLFYERFLSEWTGQPHARASHAADPV